MSSVLEVRVPPIMLTAVDGFTIVLDVRTKCAVESEDIWKREGIGRIDSLDLTWST